MEQQKNRPSAAPMVFSIIALVFSSLALVSAILFIIVLHIGPESGGTATALTGRAVLTVSGMILFTAATWGCAMTGGFLGFIMMIVDIAVKRLKILWIPILSMVLGIAGIIICAAGY